MSTDNNITVRVYRKKPVAVNVVQLCAENSIQQVAQWCGGKHFSSDGEMWIEIPTLEGVMRANYLDYIIQGVNGEFYPCKPDIFEKTYEISIRNIISYGSG